MDLSIIVSIALGFGVSLLFYKACKDNKCLVVKSYPEEINKYYYKAEDGNCYKYTKVTVECD
jgi:hypothetical protein